MASQCSSSDDDNKVSPKEEASLNTDSKEFGTSDEDGVGPAFKRQMDIVFSADKLEEYFESLPNKLLDSDPEVENAVLKKASIALRNPNRNRGVHALPFDDNRVVVENVKNGYVNASKMYYSRFKSYIVGQLPFADADKRLPACLESAYGIFWLMVYQQKVRAIIMLTSEFGENESTSLKEFLPMSTDEEMCFVVLKKERRVCTVRVTLNHLTTVGDGSSQFELRELSIDYCDGLPNVKSCQFTERHTAYHVRVVGLNKGFKFDCVAYLNFYGEVTRCLEKRIAHLNQQHAKYLVLCSDGCTESALFTIVDIVLTHVRKERTAAMIDIFKLVEELREQRKGFLSTSELLRFCFEIVNAAVPMLDKAGYLMNMFVKLVKVEMRRIGQSSSED